ncbi:trimethylamine methyltransferase family protein [Candidatus Bipolaricaulota bacterium]|nr:trimethylamine methyltransferase family protein [Candidatus Bipolaricaulota bacterium]
MIRADFLSDKAVKDIHSKAKRILSEVGVQVDSNKAQELLHDSGAEIDRSTNLVKFTNDIIEESINKAPGEVIYGGREAKFDVSLGYSSGFCAHPPGGAEGFLDGDTKEYRSAKTKDAVNWIQLADYLPEIDTCTSIYPSDVDNQIRDIQVTRLLLKNTTKHIHVSPYGKENLDLIIKMAKTIQTKEQLNNRPIVSVVASTTSPLKYDKDSFDVLSSAGKHGIPVEMATMPMAGASSPITMAGTITLAHAELLTAIVLSQLANPGAPIISFPLPSIFDMKTSNIIEGRAENALMTAALAKIQREACNIPIAVSGLVTDSLLPDGQSMIERSFNVLLSSLSGVSAVVGAGQIEHYYTGSLEQLVVDNEILAMARKVLNGITVNLHTSGVKEIEQAGPGGDFFTDDLTMQHFKTEYLEPETFDSLSRDSWASKGNKDLFEKAQNRVNSILNSHTPSKLSKEKEERLDEIYKESRKLC